MFHTVRNSISFKTMIDSLGRKSQPPQRKELKGEERDGQQHLQGTKSSFSFLSGFQYLFPILSSQDLHRNNHPAMESPPRYKFTVIFFIIISLSLGLISFILCIAAEIKRNKKEDLRWNGKLCYLPSSPAFGLGIAALVGLFLAQIIGNSILFRHSCSGGKRNAQYKIPALARVLLLISWLSFGLAVILLIAATSMSRRQPYGVGWLNGECYLIKVGTYAGSAVLVVVAVGSVISSALLITKTCQADQGRKIHAQMG